MTDTTEQGVTASGRELACVGVSALEEQAYTVLLDDPAVTVAALAERLGVSQRRARDVLSGLEAHGLVSCVSTRPRRYEVTDPEIAVATLVLRRQEELQRARLAAVRMAERARHAGARTLGPEMLELVSGPEDTRRQLDQLQRAAEREVCSLDRPPYVTHGSHSPTNPAEDDALTRGVSYRAIYDPRAFTYSWQPAELRHFLQAGEQVRVYPDLPTKMIIVDRRVAFIPLDAHQPGAESLLVRAPAVVDTLQMFFETLWAQATRLPTPSDAAGMTSLVGDRPEQQMVDLVNLLLAGLKDEVIARQLGVSASTLDRRVRALMRSLGVRTRFQLGWQARGRFQNTVGPLEPPSGSGSP